MLEHKWQGSRDSDCWFVQQLRVFGGRTCNLTVCVSPVLPESLTGVDLLVLLRFVWGHVRNPTLTLCVCVCEKETESGVGVSRDLPLRQELSSLVARSGHQYWMACDGNNPTYKPLHIHKYTCSCSRSSQHQELCWKYIMHHMRNPETCPVF